MSVDVELCSFSDIDLLYGLKHAFSTESRREIATELANRGIPLPARDDRRALGLYRNRGLHLIEALCQPEEVNHDAV